MENHFNRHFRSLKALFFVLSSAMSLDAQAYLHYSGDASPPEETQPAAAVVDNKPTATAVDNKPIESNSNGMPPYQAKKFIDTIKDDESVTTPVNAQVPPFATPHAAIKATPAAALNEKEGSIAGGQKKTEGMEAPIQVTADTATPLVRPNQDQDTNTTVHPSTAPPKVMSVAYVPPTPLSVFLKKPSGFYKVSANETLRTILSRWAATATSDDQWSLVWDAPNDYSVSANANYTGGFVEAVGELFKDLAGNGAPFSVEVYDGNHVIRVIRAK